MANSAVSEVVELVLKATTEAKENANLVPARIIELISAISSQPFEAFATCHRHLHERINGQLGKESSSVPKVASRQLKMCLHERDQEAHWCVHKILVSYFQVYKASSRDEAISVDAALLPQVFEFITSFTCISQLANVLDLFELRTCDRQVLVPFAKQMIEQSCLIHASIVIHQLDIRDHFDSNMLLLELLYEDNLLDIEAYLQLDSLKLNPSTVLTILQCDGTIESQSSSKHHSILIQFMRYLDDIHASADHSNVPLFERLRPIAKKQFLKKIFRFVFELIKRPVFAELDDATLHRLCPNITMCFYNKQLAALFFRFKEESVPMSPNVITDHVEALKNLAIGSQLIPHAHEHVLSLYSKRNDFASAAEYIQLHNLTSNLFTPCEANNLLVKPTVQSYSTSLSLGKGIHIVQTEQQFDECLEQIQQWDFVSLDSEWFTNFFVLRSNTVVSLIQVAHDNVCYLLDCVKLASKSRPLHFYLGQFITKVINNKSILKLGYSVQNDFDVFWKSYLHSVGQESSEVSSEISLSPANVLDFREFFFYLINSATNCRDLFDPTRLSIATQLSGISQVTYVLTGFSIDKTEQLSDWSKRPLRDSQITYAAIDAYCLVDCYRQLELLFQNKKNVTILSFINDVFRKQTNPPSNGNYSLKSANTSKNKADATSEDEPPTAEVEPIRIDQFRCVVDDMLFGIIRYLRICNADALMADPKNREQSVLMALKEGRIFITSGQVYERYRKYFSSPQDCIKLSNNCTALEQFKELAHKCRLIIHLEDLFARCSLCNTTPFIIISTKEFKSHHEQFLKQLNQTEQSANEGVNGENKAEPFTVPATGDRSEYRIDFESFGKMKFINKMPQVDKFYICSNANCGHIYWDGCHSSNFIHSIKSLIVDA